MDFGSLLHKAQKNEKVVKKEPIRCYKTKFEPPKKEQRNKQLSVNIKKFLAKKEAEEKEERLEALRKKEKLLALRAKDKKATRCMNVMLKRTKSANQSVLQDAVDNNNTSVTLAGPIQPDEDDYGYVSQEASAYYNKMMEKYSKMPDEPKFSLNKKKVSTDLKSTRERVAAAIEREREEANMPHKRKRKRKEEEGEKVEETFLSPPPPKPKPKVLPQAPVLNFNDLLKLAEKKQYEPIVIEQKPKEEERLLTKKQKKEMERVQEWRDRKEGKLPPLENKKIGLEMKIPKLNEKKSVPEKLVQKPVMKEEKKVNVPSLNSSLSKAGPSTLNKSIDLKRREEVKSSKVVPNPKKVVSLDNRPKQLPSNDLKPKKDVRPPQMPARKEFRPKDLKRKPLINNKRRIMDDDEDYDSEMDDFIDDGPEGAEDYSKYISEIFGYDKSKYRNVDDDIDNMESTFAQQMREEVISTKIGKMEDLEDMKQEEEDKKRKALLKKKRFS